jgi:hypothetical protein
MKLFAENISLPRHSCRGMREFNKTALAKYTGSDVCRDLCVWLKPIVVHIEPRHECRGNECVSGNENII